MSVRLSTRGRHLLALREDRSTADILQERRQQTPMTLARLSKRTHNITPEAAVLVRHVPSRAQRSYQGARKIQLLL